MTELEAKKMCISVKEKLSEFMDAFAFVGYDLQGSKAWTVVHRNNLERDALKTALIDLSNDMDELENNLE